MIETVDLAAIRLDGKVYALPRPARHGDVIHHMVTVCKLTPPIRQGQGFKTSRGRFVTRAEALEIATKAGQVPNGILGSVLTSEDLW